MIRFLFRFIGIVLLALAFIFVVYDGMKSIASHMFYATRIEQFWTEIHSRSLQMLRESIEALHRRGNLALGGRADPRSADRARVRALERFADPAGPQEEAADRLRAGVTFLA